VSDPGRVGSGAALAADLAAPDAATRARALAALARQVRLDGGAAIDHAVARALHVPLGSADRSEQRRAADLVASLAAGAPPLLAALRDALGAAEARLRWGAAYALGSALPPTRELWPSARETMRLDDGDQRWAAAELTCRIAQNEPEVVDDLRAALADPSPTLRKMVLYCLRDLRDPGAAAAARELLDDPDAGVRLAALAALSVADGDAAAIAIRVAVVLAADPDAGVRRAAAVTLGKLGTAAPEALAALRTAARADDASLARAATSALRILLPPG